MHLFIFNCNFLNASISIQDIHVDAQILRVVALIFCLNTPARYLCIFGKSDKRQEKQTTAELKLRLRALPPTPLPSSMCAVGDRIEKLTLVLSDDAKVSNIPKSHQGRRHSN